jgi:hypothetical protein
MVWVPLSLSRDIPKNTTRTIPLDGQRLTVRREHRTIGVTGDGGRAYSATETGGMVWINPAGMTEPPPVFLAGLSIVSLAIKADAATILRLLGNPTPHPDAQLVEVTLDGVNLMLGWHTPQPGRTMLHVVTTDPGNVESRALVALHHLRAAAEAAGAPPAAG